MKLTRLAPLLVAAALAACDSNGTTDPDDLSFGRFDGSVRGDVSAGIEGEAYSYNTPTFGQDEVVLVDEGEGILVDIYHSTDDLSEGTSSINDWTRGDGGVLAVVYMEDGGRYFVSVDGTLRLTDVHGDGVTGRAEFLAVEVDPDTEEVLSDEIEVDVAFRAAYDGEITGARRATGIRSLRQR
jgi:hypothetical protein